MDRDFWFNNLKNVESVSICIVFDKKSIVVLIFVPLCVIQHFTLASYKFFFYHPSFGASGYGVPWCSILYVFYS